MKIKILAVFTIFSVISVLCQAQDIKYVSYFPVPFALHEQINVKTLAILGSRGGANISSGSESKITGVFTADEEFIAVGDMTVTSHQNSNPTINESPVDLVVDGLAGQTSSNPEYDGSIGSVGKMEIVSFKGSGVRSVVANNNAVITGLKWGSLGGIGLNGSGGVNWPSECSGGNFSKGLTWVQLKLQGSNEYKTYLTCAGTSGGGPGGCTSCSGTPIGGYASCGDGRQKLCQSDCTWGACACPNLYVWNGTECVLSGGGGVTPVQINTTAVVSPGSSGGSSCGNGSYTLCQPGTGSWIDSGQINPDGCRQRTTQPVCYNDYIVSGNQQKYVCTELSMPNCSGSNYQSICNTNGKGYKCKISASGDYNSAWICMCEWDNGSSSCGEASGLSCTNMCFDGEGVGKYLSCE